MKIREPAESRLHDLIELTPTSDAHRDKYHDRPPRHRPPDPQDRDKDRDRDRDRHRILDRDRDRDRHRLLL